MPTSGPRAASALPSVQARVLAFLAILLAGLAGAAIGASFVSVQCKGSCTTPTGIGGIVGGAVAAGGVAVVATLTLRAMGEWKRISEDRLAGNPATKAGNPAAKANDPDPAAVAGGPSPRADDAGPYDGFSSRNPSA